MKKATILGAIAGDTIGSLYEFGEMKDYNFPLFEKGMMPTDDSVMTCAVADWLLSDPEHKEKTLVDCMRAWGRKYPREGYGGGFFRWLISPAPKPYNSWGNGSAMRVSPVGFAFDTLAETLEVAKISASVTHNHPEGIRGAQATAAVIFMARNGMAKEDIRKYITQLFKYDLTKTCDEIRPDYHFDVSCMGTVPQAITAFLDSKDYEDAIRLGISLGGDADTIGAITGGMAAAFYKEIPDEIYDFVWGKMGEDMREVVMRFEERFTKREQKEKCLEDFTGLLAECERKKIVFFTGAGISKESGIPTFRDSDGLWRKYDPKVLASASGFFENLEAALEFYNERRANLAKCRPNRAHELIAELEKSHDVTVITQNVDDLHERAGSTNVIHLHGELRKVTSSENRIDSQWIQEYPLEKPIKVGDKAADGSQLRPAVVMFGEFLPSWEYNSAVKAVHDADIFIVIGTSLQVYPAAGLVDYADKFSCKKFVIDPNIDTEKLELGSFIHIPEGASAGLEKLLEVLQKEHGHEE